MVPRSEATTATLMCWRDVWLWPGWQKFPFDFFLMPQINGVRGRSTTEVGVGVVVVGVGGGGSRGAWTDGFFLFSAVSRRDSSFHAG